MKEITSEEYEVYVVFDGVLQYFFEGCEAVFSSDGVRFIVAEMDVGSHQYVEDIFAVRFFRHVGGVNVTADFDSRGRHTLNVLHCGRVANHSVLKRKFPDICSNDTCVYNTGGDQRQAYTINCMCTFSKYLK